MTRERVAKDAATALLTRWDLLVRGLLSASTGVCVMSSIAVGAQPAEHAPRTALLPPAGPARHKAWQVVFNGRPVTSNGHSVVVLAPVS